MSSRHIPMLNKVPQSYAMIYNTHAPCETNFSHSSSFKCSCNTKQLYNFNALSSDKFIISTEGCHYTRQ
jgi:hypothetical protein